MLALTRRPAKIGMGYGIDILHVVVINGIPLTPPRVQVTLEPWATPKIIMEHRFSPAIFVIAPVFETGLEVTILTNRGSSTGPTKRTTGRNTGVIITFCVIGDAIVSNGSLLLFEKIHGAVI